MIFAIMISLVGVIFWAGFCLHKSFDLDRDEWWWMPLWISSYFVGSFFIVAIAAIVFDWIDKIMGKHFMSH